MKLPYAVTFQQRGPVVQCNQIGGAIEAQLDYVANQMYTPSDAKRVLGARNHISVTRIAEKYGIKCWTRSTTTLYYKPHVDFAAKSRKEAAEGMGLGDFFEGKIPKKDELGIGIKPEKKFSVTDKGHSIPMRINDRQEAEEMIAKWRGD